MRKMTSDIVLAREARQSSRDSGAQRYFLSDCVLSKYRWNMMNTMISGSRRWRVRQRVNSRHAALAAAALALTACDSMPSRDPAFAPSFPAPLEVPQQRQAATGAIYQVGYDKVLFFTNHDGLLVNLTCVVWLDSLKASANRSAWVNG